MKPRSSSSMLALLGKDWLAKCTNVFPKEVPHLGAVSSQWPASAKAGGEGSDSPCVVRGAGCVRGLRHEALATAHRGAKRSGAETW